MVIFLRCGHICMYYGTCTCMIVHVHVHTSHLWCLYMLMAVVVKYVHTCTCINNVVYCQSSSSFIHPSPDFPIMATHTKQRTRNTNYNGDTPLVVNRCLFPLLSCHPSAKMGMAVKGGVIPEYDTCWHDVTYVILHFLLSGTASHHTPLQQPPEQVQPMSL